MDPAAAMQFSFLDLFMKADWVVKSVMIGLAAVSVWSWAVAIDKFSQLRRLEASARAIESQLAEGKGLEGLDQSARAGDAMARVVSVGLAEMRASRRTAQGTPLSDAGIERTLSRMQQVMGAAITRETARAEQGLGILASIGSSSPFIGLFGTVWGIMNAFRGIAASRDTSLAVVAPGIAEALFATALGLLAAIPAVLFYNALTAGFDRFAARLDVVTEELVARASRRLSDGG